MRGRDVDRDVDYGDVEKPSRIRVCVPCFVKYSVGLVRGRDVDYGDVEEDQELVRVFTTFEESGVEYVVRQTRERREHHSARARG